jgi:hypothetical protein
VLCAAARRDETLNQFARRVRAEPKIKSYVLGDTEQADQITVPTTLTYRDSSVNSVSFLLEQDADTGQLEVCGVKE